jgi:hypothetical protein
MLALAIEFSRCSRVRTLKAEQRVVPHVGTIGNVSASTWSLPTQVPDERRRRRGAKWLLRKEVIQPHLPVRLPCYDFTPIASPAFDGSLPKGLGHRLRALPTFVV